MAKKSSKKSGSKKSTKVLSADASKDKMEKKAKKTQTTQKSPYKRGSLGKAIYAYFDECASAKAEPKYEQALSIAQGQMPETKFNKAHYAWYKNKWKQNNM